MPSHGLGRERIIRDRKVLEHTLKTGKVVRTKFFRAHCLTGVGPPGVAFLAGRRVGGAVRRNRARRVLREAFRLSDHELSRTATLVFIASENAADAPFAELRDAIEAALDRLSFQVS